MNTTPNQTAEQYIANRLATQRGGQGKIIRQALRNFARKAAKFGNMIPSGYGVTVKVQASI